MCVRTYSSTSMRSYTFMYTAVYMNVCICTYVHIIYTYAYIYMNICVFVRIRRQDTGWRRLIGCLKLQVIFCKRATNYRALLRKVAYEDKPSYASSPPCIQIHSSTGWRRCIGCLILTGHSPQNRPIISGSFAKRDLQLKVSYATSQSCIGRT